MSEQTEMPTHDTDADELYSAAKDAFQALDLAETVDADDLDDQLLAEIVGLCKRVENAAEDARKEVFEPELSDRVEEGEQVGPVTKRTGSSSYVTDDAGAFDAVLDAGHDPRDVASVSVSDLKDVLGADAEEYLGSSEYSYFRR